MPFQNMNGGEGNGFAAPRDLREDLQQEEEGVRHDEEAGPGHGARAVLQERSQGQDGEQGEKTANILLGLAATRVRGFVQIFCEFHSWTVASLLSRQARETIRELLTKPFTQVVASPSNLPDTMIQHFSLMYRLVQ